MLPALVLTALVVAAALRTRLGALGDVVLGLLALAWLAVNGPVEGTILLTITDDHGVTGADLAGLAALAIAGTGLLRRRREVTARSPEGGRIAP